MIEELSQLIRNRTSIWVSLNPLVLLVLVQQSTRLGCSESHLDIGHSHMVSNILVSVELDSFKSLQDLKHPMAHRLRRIEADEAKTCDGRCLFIQNSNI